MKHLKLALLFVLSVPVFAYPYGTVLGDRSWYEANRPSQPSTDRTYYIHAQNGNDSTGDGSSGNPWKTLLKIIGVASGGSHSDTYYLAGDFGADYLAVLPTTGDDTHWLVFKQWAGQSQAILRGTGGYNPLTVSGNGWIWVEGLYFETDPIADGGAAIAAYYSPGPYVVLNSTFNRGSIQLGGAPNSWIEGNTILGSATSYVSGIGGIGVPVISSTMTITTHTVVEAGNVTSGTHTYVWNFTYGGYGGSELSLPGSSESSIYWPISQTVTADGTHGKVNLWIPLGPNGTTARRVYRMYNGATTYFLLTTINDNSTTFYQDNKANGSLGDPIPIPTGNTGEAINILDDNVTPMGVSSNTVIYNNNIGACGHIGIAWVTRANYLRHYGMRIAYNTINNPWAGGISGSFSTATIIEGNDIKNIGRIGDTDIPRFVQTVNGLIVQGYRTKARYNVVDNSEGEQLFVQGNIFGSLVQDAVECEIYYNLFKNGRGAGMIMGPRFTSDVSSNTIHDNIFYNNCLGPFDAYHGTYNNQKFELWINVNTGDGGDATLEKWVPGGTKTLNFNSIYNNLWSVFPNFMVYYAPYPYATSDYTLNGTASQFGSYFTNNLQVSSSNTGQSWVSSLYTVMRAVWPYSWVPAQIRAKLRANTP